MKYPCRKANGMTALEVALVASLSVMFCIFAIDVWFFVWGYTLNDTAARDAARAAANAGDLTTAQRHIQGSLYRHRGFGAVGNPTCDWQTNHDDFVFAKDPEDGIPYVRVTTRCTLTPPFPIYLFGQGWSAGPTELKRTYTFPLVVMPFRPRTVTHPSTPGGDPGDGEGDPLFDG
jgi:hypothetical protein